MKLFSISVLFFATALILVLTRDAKPHKEKAAFQAGANDFQAEFLDGSTHRLSDFEGKIILVNFWAVWCAPCRAEIPALLEVYHERKNHFEIIGIAEASEVAAIRAFVEELKVDYPIALDPEGEIGQRYKITGYPTSFLFAPDGTLAGEYLGFLSEDTLRKDLAALEKKYAR